MPLPGVLQRQLASTVLGRARLGGRVLPVRPAPAAAELPHEDDGGMHYNCDYHARERAAGADVDVCLGGRIAVTLI